MAFREANSQGFQIITLALGEGLIRYEARLRLNQAVSLQALSHNHLAKNIHELLGTVCGRDLRQLLDLCLASRRLCELLFASHTS
jgi:hypothetical protein